MSENSSPHRFRDTVMLWRLRQLALTNDGALGRAAGATYLSLRYNELRGEPSVWFHSILPKVEGGVVSYMQPQQTTKLFRWLISETDQDRCPTLLLIDDCYQLDQVERIRWVKDGRLLLPGELA